MKRCPWRSSIVALVLMAGCSAPKETTKVGALKPELTITLGSINLASHTKRIEKRDVVSMARTLKREQVDVLALQSVTRYPGLENRIDLVKELAAQTDLRQAFGEMVNSGGKQTGNAVFSTYPLHSNTNVMYDGVKSAGFEAALATVIDGGVRDIAVVSLQLPEKASARDLDACLSKVQEHIGGEHSMPTILFGNLPSADSNPSFAEFKIPTAKSGAARTWYSNNGSLSVLSTRTVETDLGPMAVFQFGLFRQTSK
ncbi:MAG: hypothetical protein HY966_06270 [Ignavibacteriales bacterium]|nr:hypothetical protein [Ignavibacteriales bacterium]